MKRENYRVWLAERAHRLPNEDELKLKHQLLHAQAWQLVNEVKKKRRIKGAQLERLAANKARVDRPQQQQQQEEDQKQNQLVSSRTKQSVVTDNDLALFHQYVEELGNVDEDNAPMMMTFSDLPNEVRASIFSFIPVVSHRYVDDLHRMQRILLLQDAEVLRDPEFSQGLLHTVRGECRGLHAVKVGEFALIAVCMGLSIRTWHPQREEAFELLNELSKEIRVQLWREEHFSNWTIFRERVMDSPCSEVRDTLREDLVAWQNLFQSWGLTRQDVMYEVACSELKYLQDRCRGIEFIGDPALEFQDMHNIFWELNLKVPDGVTEEYSQSIRVSQAITLGMLDLPWVRGYAWEEKVLALPPDETDVVALPAALQPQTSMLSSSAGSPRDNITSTLSGEERISRLMSAKSMIMQAEAEVAELERQRREEEKEVYEKRQHARYVAMQGMTQRLWMTTQQFRHRWHHRFSGCEMCASLPIHLVGVAKPNSGAPEDIVLCNGCFNELYADEDSVQHRMYEWYEVRDLIDNPGEDPTINGIGEAAVSEDGETSNYGGTLSTSRTAVDPLNSRPVSAAKSVSSPTSAIAVPPAVSDAVPLPESEREAATAVPPPPTTTTTTTGSASARPARPGSAIIFVEPPQAKGIATSPLD